MPFKLKIVIFEHVHRFFEIFEKYSGFKHGHVKLKKPKQLQEILDIARALLADIHTRHADPEIEEKQGKLEQLKSVLEMYAHALNYTCTFTRYTCTLTYYTSTLVCVCYVVRLKRLNGFG